MINLLGLHISLILSISILVPIFLGVAFITLLERKFLSLVGLRLGPNKALLGGLAQPIMDALKLIQKESNYLTNFSCLFYYLSGGLMMVCSLSLWVLMILESPSNIKSSILLVMLILGLNSVGSIMAGWSVFSKFSLIGSIRTVSLLISYESILYLILMIMIYSHSSMDLSEYLSFSFLVVISSPMMFMMWFLSMLADLNRTPYDFSEGESELVSGFNTEFGASVFTLIFLSEYGNILFFSFFTSVMFFFTHSLFFSWLVFCSVLWIRSVVPRYRFDKLMNLAWKFLIPVITLIMMFYTPLWS